MNSLDHDFDKISIVSGVISQCERNAIILKNIMTHELIGVLKGGGGGGGGGRSPPSYLHDQAF